MSSALSPESRDASLAAARSGTFDVVVVGGGITGAGVALDAASRGLSVVLVEADDIASGTSSRSGKTVHGGLRYLEQLNFGLVAEALRERDLMVRTLAPHLVRPEPFLFPLTKHWQRPYIGAGVLLYDLMARAGGRHGVPHHRHLSRRGVLRAAPGLDGDVVTGGLQYYDGRMDDARHTVAVARTAAAHGAHVLSHARVVGVLPHGVTVEDSITGARFGIAASVVVNAAGVWAAEIQRMAGTGTFGVTPAKGVHLVIDRGAFDSTTGILARAEDSVIILRKWFGHWLLGTTDTAYTGDLRAPTVDPEDVDYLLRNVNRYLAKPLDRSDVLGAYAGVRPLLTRTGSTTSALSRDHAVIEEPAGMVTIVGGKYTTYRVMARDAVDAVGRALGRALPPSPTAELPLVGAAGWAAIRNRAARIAAEHGLPVAHVERMLERYGDEVPAVLAAVREDPALGTPIGGHLGAELRYAVTHEGACTFSDIMTRRTHIAIEQPDGGTEIATTVAALIAPLLGWDEDRIAREVANYRAEAARDRAAL